MTTAPKILNLILYNQDVVYDNMKAILRDYMKAANPTIKYYFYSYDPSLTTDYEFRGDELLIKGTETVLPGILEKTIDAIHICTGCFNFDYIIRTNISTVCNFAKLARFLQSTPVQYSGPQIAALCWLDPPSGIKDTRYFGVNFAFGTGIILSREMCRMIIYRKKEIMDYGLIDDVAIGVFFHNHKVIPYNLETSGRFKYLKNATEEQIAASSSNVIFFRNKHDHYRNIDVVTMRHIMNHITVMEQADSIAPSLETLYIAARDTPSDINEHLPIHLQLAQECDSVVDIGVRSMVSTWGLLHGLKPGSAYTGIYLYLPDTHSFHLAKSLAEQKGVAFRFIAARNDMTIAPRDIGQVDMIFIDSLHTYCHLMYELERFSHLARKYLTFHDSSEPWGDTDDLEYSGDRTEYPSWIDRTKRGVWPAIDDFLKDHPEWSLKERRTNNHGFTVLCRTEHCMAASSNCFVYDVFIYNGEPIAKLRLKLMAPFVDEFIVTESWYTFAGVKKPFLWFERNRDVFEPYMHKIHFIRIDEFPEMPVDWVHQNNFYNPSDWWREHYQRDLAKKRLDELPKPFVITCTDVDEIVRPSVMRDLRTTMYSQITEPMFLDMQFFYYNFRWIKHGSWNHGFLATDRNYCIGTLTNIRMSHPRRLIVDRAGWHCSYFLSCEDLQRKLSSFAHQEFNQDQFKDTAHIRHCLNTGMDLYNRGSHEDLMEYSGEGLPEGWQEVNTEVIASQQA